MKTKERKDLHTKNLVELRTLLKNLKEAVFTAKLELSQNKLKNTRSIFLKRKEIAQILTVIKEKEIEK
ncbi:MAG: 50S ribosomal protein L29 [Patescibacteria group bacterium]|nr:50S ribosomal protein L29 [Patescibacteria group bacterium]